MIGRLRMNSRWRWEIHRPGRPPHELTSGDVFLLEVNGAIRRTAIEFRHFAGRHHRGRAGEYYSTDGFPLRHGMRAAPLY
jgi:hypothetical protein